MAGKSARRRKQVVDCEKIQEIRELVSNHLATLDLQGIIEFDPEKFCYDNNFDPQIFAVYDACMHEIALARNKLTCYQNTPFESVDPRGKSRNFFYPNKATLFCGSGELVTYAKRRGFEMVETVSDPSDSPSSLPVIMDKDKTYAIGLSAVKLWLDDYCRNNPKTNFSSAT